MLRLKESNNLLLRQYSVSRKVSKKLSALVNSKIDISEAQESETIKACLQLVSELTERDGKYRNSLKVLESGAASVQEKNELLLDIFSSLGMCTREVQLWGAEPYVGCEVWSNLYQKWIFLDANFGVYATHSGKPLSLYAIWLMKEKNIIGEIDFIGHDDFANFIIPKFGALGVPLEKGRILILNLDEKIQYAHTSYEFQYVTSPYDLYFTINRVQASIFPLESGVKIKLTHNMPWFSHFEYLCNEEWSSCKNSIVVTDVVDFQFRGVNKMGYVGAITSFSIDS